MRKKGDLYQKFRIHTFAVPGVGIITDYWGNFLPKNIVILTNLKSK